MCNYREIPYAANGTAAVSNYFSVVIVLVDLFEVTEGNLSCSILVTLGHEFLYVLIGGWEWKVVLQYGLDVGDRDGVLALLIEQVEAFLGLGILASILEASVPVPVDDVLAESEVHGVLVANFGVGLLQLSLNISWSHLVESKVGQNIPDTCTWS